VVQSRGANNTITLRTEQGTLTLQTDVFLKRGTEIALKVEQRAHESLIRIISVGGQSLTKYLEGSANTEAQDAVARSSTLVSPPDIGESFATNTDIAVEEPAINTLLRGVFLAKPELSAARAAALTSTLQTQLEQATTGTSLQVRVLFIQIPSSDGKGYIPLAAHAAMLPPPVTGTAPQTGGYALTAAQRMVVEPIMQTAQQNQQAATASLPLIAPNTSPTVPTPLSITPANVLGNLPTPPNAAQVSATGVLSTGVLSTATSTNPALPPASTESTLIFAASPHVPSSTPQLSANVPTTAPTQPLPTTQPHTLLPSSASTITSSITATVVQSAARELTVHSDLGTLKLFVTTPLPRGTLIAFELQQVTSVRGTATGETLETDFKAFEALAALTHSLATANIPHTAHILPRAGAAMGAEMLFFLSALKGGDVRAWLGEDNITRLEALKGGGSGEKSDLLSRLNTEFSSLKTIPENMSDGQWRSVLIPIYAEGQVHHLQYFYKKQKHEDANSADRASDHFMVEVDLSRLGKIQLDGLVQKQGQRLQFDLIIRTERAWEENIRAGLRDIYQAAQAISGFSGLLTFRHGSEALMPHPIDNATISTSNTGSLIV
jgi:hypothetical protein